MNTDHVEGKADAVITLANGDLLLRGWAANYEMDLEDEAFAPGAFKAAIRQFLDSGNSPLCFHHKTDVVLGKVLKLEEKARQGLWMEAVLTKPPESSPHFWIYEVVKRAIMRGWPKSRSPPALPGLRLSTWWLERVGSIRPGGKSHRALDVWPSLRRTPSAAWRSWGCGST